MEIIIKIIKGTKQTWLGRLISGSWNFLPRASAVRNLPDCWRVVAWREDVLLSQGARIKKNPKGRAAAIRCQNLILEIPSEFSSSIKMCPSILQTAQVFKVRGNCLLNTTQAFAWLTALVTQPAHHKLSIHNTICMDTICMDTSLEEAIDAYDKKLRWPSFKPTLRCIWLTPT